MPKNVWIEANILGNIRYIYVKRIEGKELWGNYIDDDTVIRDVKLCNINSIFNWKEYDEYYS